MSPEANGGPVKVDYKSFLSYESKHRSRSAIKVLRPYMSIPGMISFGGGFPHPSTWPVNGMTLSVSFAKKSIFVPGYQVTSPEGLLPTEEYVAPAESDILKPDLAAELQYSTTFGQPYFVSWLKEHVTRNHNPPYKDYGVLCTAGNTDGCDGILRSCVERGDSVLIEEFAYPGLLGHCTSLGINTVGIPMDVDGIIPQSMDDILSNWDETARGGRKPRMVIVVPTCSNPAGATIPVERRKEIYEVCRKHNILLIEDDPYYYLQIRPKGAGTPPIASFLSIDVDGRVIRLDSFSKIVAPGSRCGFMTGPTELITEIMYSRETSTQCPSGFSIAAIASILRAWGSHDGFEQKYLPYISDVYAKRAISMSNAITKHVPAQGASAPPPSGGMFLFLRLHIESHPRFKDPSVDPDTLGDEVFQTLLDAKVLTVPGKFFKTPGTNWSREEQAKKIFLRLSFATATPEQIEEGIQRLGKAVKTEWGL